MGDSARVTHAGDNSDLAAITRAAHIAWSTGRPGGGSRSMSVVFLGADDSFSLHGLSHPDRFHSMELVFLCFPESFVQCGVSDLPWFIQYGWCFSQSLIHSAWLVFLLIVDFIPRRWDYSSQMIRFMWYLSWFVSCSFILVYLLLYDSFWRIGISLDRWFVQRTLVYHILLDWWRFRRMDRKPPPGPI